MVKVVLVWFGLLIFGLVICEEFITIKCISLLNTTGLLQRAKWRESAAASERRVASSSPAGPNIMTKLPSGSERVERGGHFIANDQTDKCRKLQAILDKST